MNDSRIEVISLMTICEIINTPRTLSVYLMMKYESYDEYLGLDIDPGHYDSAWAFGNDYFVTKFLSKWKGFITNGSLLKNIAIGDWLAAEDNCLETNKRLTSLDPSFSKEDRSVLDVLYIAGRKISEILGPLPCFKTISDHCSWSNGSTYDLRLGATIADKLTSKLTVTNGALFLGAHIVGHDPGWCESIGLKIDGPCSLLPVNFTHVKGNKVTTVPKNAKTDRVISIEPTLNIYIQKGIGSVIRSRLKRYGVSLDDQTINRDLAKAAFRGGLGTLDLSSASDTISIALVRQLLPYQWFDLLDDVRSKESKLGHTFRRVNKFSSMGNGFTFELESLIFYGLAYAISMKEFDDCGTLSVYGDDIIVDIRLFNKLVEYFPKFGFKINESKSFSYSRFHESCGGHYFDGFDVTPAYQKNASGRLEEVIRLHNRIFRWSERSGLDVSSVLQKIILHSRKKFNAIPRIPRYATGDDGYLSSTDSLGHYDINRGYCCFVYRAVQRDKKMIDLPIYSYKMSKSMTPYSYKNSHSKGYCVTTAFSRYRLSKAYFNK